MSQDKKIGRNDICFCGSGKKFKNCCSGKSQPAKVSVQALQQKSLTPQMQANISAQLELAVAYHQAGQLGDAERVYRAILQLDANHADANHLLGLLANQLNKHEIAVQMISKAIKIKPKFAEAHNNLGLALQALGRVEEAKKHYEKALQINPELAEVYNNMAILFKRGKELDKSIAWCNKALSINPRFIPAKYNLADTYLDKKQYIEAEAGFKQLLSLDASYENAHCQLGLVYSNQEKYELAIESLNIAKEINPGLVSAFKLLASIMIKLHKVPEAIDFIKKVSELEPSNPIHLSDLLVYMQYCENVDEKALFLITQAFSNRFEAKFLSQPTANKSTKIDSNCPLRVAYVSPDFRRHPITNFIEPILDHHDLNHFELYCYYNNQIEDQVTARLKKRFKHWINVSSMSDDEVVKHIKSDHIDILIDLSGHTFPNSLTVFAQKPAPIQVSWMGYVGSTGLKSIDYRLTDKFVEPENIAPEMKVESPWFLNPVWYVYRPCIGNPEIRNTEAMLVQQTPAIENGYITLGSLNNILKITPATILIWAKILKKLPNAQLMIVSDDSERLRQIFWQHFERYEINANRITILKYENQINHYLLYHRIDIALDTFPYSGGTTTCDAVWMGVPVITMAGKVFRSRMGVTIANNVGHPEWVASDENDYIEKAILLAQNPEKLNTLRLGLRAEMESSPLMDEVGFTRKLEQAYREMWVNYCNQEA